MDAVRRRWHAGRTPTRVPGGLILSAVVILGAILGLFVSVFGPYYGVLFAAVFAVVGLVVRRRDAEWGALLLAFGVGLLVGAAFYIVLGLLAQGAPGSGSGTGRV